MFDKLFPLEQIAILGNLGVKLDTGGPFFDPESPAH